MTGRAGHTVSDTPQPWNCPTGHRLGHVARAGRIRRLFLYRQADEPRDVIAALTGNARIVCSVCRQEREWDVAAEALQELLERRQNSFLDPLDSDAASVIA